MITVTMSPGWSLYCSSCDATADGDVLASLCVCGQPWLTRVTLPPRAQGIDHTAHGLWRYRSVLPVRAGEPVVALGEGWTPMLESPSLARALGITRNVHLPVYKAGRVEA